MCRALGLWKWADVLSVFLETQLEGGTGQPAAMAAVSCVLREPPSRRRANLLSFLWTRYNSQKWTYSALQTDSVFPLSDWLLAHLYKFHSDMSTI